MLMILGEDMGRLGNLLKVEKYLFVERKISVEEKKKKDQKGRG